MQPGWVNAPPREGMMHQISMDASIAIFKRVNIDEPERQHRCSDNSVEILLFPLIEGYQSRHKRGNILMARVNMIWDRLLRIWVVLTNKAAFAAEAHFQKTLVTDDDVL
jgi:hypothetical protein